MDHERVPSSSSPRSEVEKGSNYSQFIHYSLGFFAISPKNKSPQKLQISQPEISLCRVYNRSEVGDRHYHYQYNSRLSTSSSRVKTKSTANSTVESSHQKIVTRQLLNIDPLAPSNTADHEPASGNYLPKEGGEEMEFEILRPTTTTVVVDDISMEYMGSEHHHQDIKNYLQKSTDRFPLPDISSPSSMLQNSSQKCLSDWIPIAVDRNVSVEYYYND